MSSVFGSDVGEACSDLQRSPCYRVKVGGRQVFGNLYNRSENGEVRVSQLAS